MEGVVKPDFVRNSSAGHFFCPRGGSGTESGGRATFRRRVGGDWEMAPDAGAASRSVRVCIPAVRTPGWSQVAPPSPPPLLSKKSLAFRAEIARRNGAHRSAGTRSFPFCRPPRKSGVSSNRGKPPRPDDGGFARTGRVPRMRRRQRQAPCVLRKERFFGVFPQVFGNGRRVLPPNVPFPEMTSGGIRALE